MNHYNLKNYQGVEILNIICPTIEIFKKDIINSIIRVINNGSYDLILDKNEIISVADEAITNAIIHGNKRDPKKNIKIKIRAHDEYLDFSVRDEGNGFDPLSRIRGKDHGIKRPGICLMEELSDVSWNKKGNEISLKFSFK